MIGRAFLGAELHLRVIQVDERGEGWEVRLGNGTDGYAQFYLPADADRSERIMRMAYAVADVMAKMAHPDPVQRFPR